MLMGVTMTLFKISGASERMVKIMKHPPFINSRGGDTISNEIMDSN